MSTAANHRKRSHRSQRLHYRRREAQIMTASQYMSRRFSLKNSFLNPIRKIISSPPKRAAAVAERGGEEEC